MYAVIVASAPDLMIGPYQAHIRAADLLIAADGGALPLLRAGIVPHVAIGDMDSIGAAGLAELEAHGIVPQRFPREKDETDLELALLYAAAAGATTIDILGALGGRWDHTLANVALLALAELRERHVRLLADGQTLFLVRDAAVLEGQAGDTVSLLPILRLMLRTVRSGPRVDSSDRASLGPNPLAPRSRWNTCRSVPLSKP